MNYTTNYNLKKPATSDFYNISDFNGNADIIDSELKKAENHRSNTSNPHGVTKSQVGLGNVPNVSTNDQTPTFTQASSLDNLVSGEKLSVSFGKIMKMIAEFVSHRSNTSNPHGVTKSQVGLGNVDNTSDLNKPISTATQTALNGKAASSHSHAISDVTSLQSALNGKEASGTAATKINRSTNVNAADTNYSTLMARGESLNNSETTPNVNGAIAWNYA